MSVYGAETDQPSSLTDAPDEQGRFRRANDGATRSTTSRPDLLVAVLGMSERQPSAMFDDLTGIDGGNRLEQLAYVRATVGPLAYVERRIARYGGLQFVAGVSGNNELTTLPSPNTTSLRVPQGFSIVDDEGSVAVEDIAMRWATSRFYAAIILLPRSNMLPRSDVRLFRAAEVAFGGRVVGVVRETATSNGRSTGVAEELSQKLGRPVVSVPTGRPRAGWGRDPSWAEVEDAIERLVGLIADDGSGAGLRGAHLVNSAEAAHLVARAKEDLATVGNLEGAEPERRQAAIDLARNVWTMVLEAANHGQEVAQTACIDLLKDPPVLRTLTIDPIDIISLIDEPGTRLRTLATLGLSKDELLSMRLRAVGKAALPQIEQHLFERAERTHDDTLAEELAGSGSPDIAARATSLLGRARIQELESLAAEPPAEAAEALRSFVEANARFEEWASRANNSSFDKVREAVRVVRNRADAAQRTIMMQAAADTLSGLQALYTQPVVDLSTWQRDRLRSLSAANLWISLAPKDEEWARDLRNVVLSGIEFSRGPGEQWAHKSAQAVGSAQRRAAGIVEAWYALALLGAVIAGISLLLLGSNLPLAAILGFGGTCVVGIAVVKHRQHRDNATWQMYYMAPAFPKSSTSPGPKPPTP
jgi:hypothetical protein